MYFEGFTIETSLKMLTFVKYTTPSTRLGARTWNRRIPPIRLSRGIAIKAEMYMPNRILCSILLEHQSKHKVFGFPCQAIVLQERYPIRTQIKRRRGLEVPRQRASAAQLGPWRLEFQNSPGRHRHSVPDEAISV